VFKVIKKKILKNKFSYSLYLKKKLYIKDYKKSCFAEFGEDIFVERFFHDKSKGRYIDVGAYHPIKSSLTHCLFKKGWGGMNIDLSKSSIDLFHIDRPNDININCAISSKNKKKLSFFTSSAINQNNSLKKNNKSQKKKIISSYRLDFLQEKYNFYNVSYINIDTEGNELDVLKTINFKITKPDLISIEDNNFGLNNKQKQKKISFLLKNKYELINIIGVTMFFCKREILKKVYKKISTF